MQTREELAKLYSTFSDRQLLDIINEKDQYTSIALIAATEEIQKRNLKEEHLASYVETKNLEAKVAEHVASIELTFLEKLLYFVMWFLPFFIGIATRMNLAEAGLKTKVKQSKLFSTLGFLTLIPTGFVAVLLHLSDFGSIVIWLMFFVLTYYIEKKFRKNHATNN